MLSFEQPPMGLDRDGSYPCAAAETEGSRRATGALRAASAGLQQALAASDAAGALALLDGLETLLRDNPPEEFCADSLAEACLASSAAMTQERPVVLRALACLTGLLQLYRHTGDAQEAQCKCSKELAVIPIAQQVTLALNARGADTELQAVGLGALHALAACLSCSGRSVTAGNVRDAVGDTGAVEAAARALQQLATACSGQAVGGTPPPPNAVGAVAQGLDVLHSVCAGHAGNLARLAAAQGTAVVGAATALAAHPGGLALLTQLAACEGAAPAERQLVASSLLGAARCAAHAPQLRLPALQGLYCLLAAEGPAACSQGSALQQEELLAAVLPLLLLPGAPGGQLDDREALAAQAYGLAVAGFVTSSPHSLPSQQLVEQLQAAVAQLCALLAKHPGCVGAAGARCPYALLAEEQQQPALVGWEVLEIGLQSLVALLAASGPEGVNTPDRDGFTLLHRLAPAGVPRAIELLLSPPTPPPGPTLDLLVRTREGANALQLASRAGGAAAACAALLEPATQAAAQRVMDALLAELDQEEAEKQAQARAKKKAGDKDARPATEPGSAPSPKPASDVSAAQAAAEELHGEVPSTADLRRQELEDAYERALEARRLELERQAAQRVQQQEEQAVAAQRAASPATPTTMSAAAAAVPQPTSPQPQEGGPILVSAFAAASTPAAEPPLVSAFAAAASGPGVGSGGPSPPNSATSAARQTAFSISGVDLSIAVTGGLPSPPVALPPVSVSLSHSTMAPAPSGELPFAPQPLQQPPQQQEPPHPGLSAFSAFARAASGGLPPPSAFAAAAPPPSAFASPAGHPLAASRSGTLPPVVLHHQRSGGLGPDAVPLASAFAAAPPLSAPTAAAMQQAGMQAAGILPYPGEQAMEAALPTRSYSTHLQEALYLPGSPTSTVNAAAAAAAAAQLRSAAAAVAATAARAGSLPLQLGGRAGSAADEILQLLPLAGGAAGPGAAAAAAATLESLSRQASQQAGWGPDALAAAMDGAAADPLGKSSDPDVSGEPTRHLWIGNLGTRTPRSVLKSIFEKYGVVDDVVTFPGRMYAFVNYRTLEEAVAAYTAMQAQVVPELTGDRPLLLKFRPAKKAAAHLRALGLAAPEDGEPGAVGSATSGGGTGLSAGTPPGAAGGLLGAVCGEAGSGAAGSAGGSTGGDVDKDGNSLDPSPRIWLGNIAPTATSKSLHAVLSRFGALTDAAVFPARIGPLGYAFVKFERLEDAVRAYEALNNTVVPPLSGSKQLKMRYKPPSDGPSGKEDVVDGSRVMVPSRHLWLGNVTQKPTDEAVLEVFSAFGKVDSVRVFPVKAYAFVNFAEIASAIKAMGALEGVPIPALTGVKPLVMRYQQEAVVAAAAGTGGSKPPGVGPEVPALGLGANAAAQLLPALLGEEGAPGAAVEDMPHALPNLSNRLNPNNIHFDPGLAERYKTLSRREKDMLWATDQLMTAHQIAAQQQAAGAAVAAAGGMPDPSMLRTMLRSHSWNVSMLAQHLQAVGPNQPANGVSPALAAAAAIAAARQAQEAREQSYNHSQIAAMRLLSPDGGGSPYAAQQQQGQAAAAGGGGMLAPPPVQQQQQHAAHLLAPSTSTSQAHLSAVLSNLAALQRMGGPSAGGPPLGAAPTAHMQRAASMPPAPGLPQHSHCPPDFGAGALLSQGLIPGAGSQHDTLGSIAMPTGSAPMLPTLPSDPLDMTSLSSMLAGHSLSPASAPMPMSPPQQQHHHHPGLGGPGSPPLRHPGSPPMLGGGHGALQGVQGMQQHVPDQLLCPLSGQVMLDPVLAADGVTYERKAIADWLSVRDTSPITQAPLPHKMLTPSVASKAALMDFLQRTSAGRMGLS